MRKLDEKKKQKKNKTKKLNGQRFCSLCIFIVIGDESHYLLEYDF